MTAASSVVHEASSFAKGGATTQALDNGGNVAATPAAGDQNINGVLDGTEWTLTTISFGFPTAANQYGSYGYDHDGNASTPNHNETTGFGAVNAAFMTAARAIIDDIAAFTLLTFTEDTANPGNAVLRFGETTNPRPNYAANPAYANFPNEVRPGDMWFDTGAFSAPDEGNFQWFTIAHEIGHTLGLKHGHIGGGPANTAMTADRDALEYSIMTYRSFIGFPDAQIGTLSNAANNFPQSYMMYDIAALQHMYGADYTSAAVNPGNTVYTFSTATGEMFVNGVGQGAPAANIVFRTIWDGGGTDTYDLSNYGTALSLDLTPGGFSDFSRGGNFQAAQLRTQPLPGDPPPLFARGQVYNALIVEADAANGNRTRPLIENAIGGSGHDSILGNEVRNELIGGSGNDTLDGVAADDTLAGNPGNDVLRGGAGADRLTGDAGGDLLDGGTGAAGEHDTAVYTASPAGVAVTLGALIGNTGGDATGDILVAIEDLAGSLFADTLTGDGAENVIFGDAGHDRLFGRSGNDLLTGGSGNDTLAGGAGLDWLLGTGGTLLPGEFDMASYEDAGFGVLADLAAPGFNTGDAAGDLYSNIRGLIGSAYNDDLFGDDITNRLEGGAGDDDLDGRGGVDTLTGGTGNDYYYLGATAAPPGTTGFFEYDHVSEAPGGGTDTVVVVPDLVSPALYYTAYALGADIEYGIVGGTGTRAFDLTGNSTDNRLWGNNGVNRLNGGDGNDTLWGAGGYDRLTGGAGNDLYILDTTARDPSPLYIFTGYDIVVETEGGGIDTIQIQRAPADSGFYSTYTLPTPIEIGEVIGIEAFSLAGHAGNNTLSGNEAVNTLSGSGGHDSLDGRGDHDTLRGGDGNDTHRGGAGYDRLEGGAGDDLYILDTTARDPSPLYVFTGYDIVIEAEGGGIDTIHIRRAPSDFGFYTSLTLQATIENAAVMGPEAFNLTGNSAANQLTGNEGSEILTGLGGDDILSGNGGADTLSGGEGNDSFLAFSGFDSFEGSDGIDLVDYGALDGGMGGVVVYLDGSMAPGGLATGDRLTDIENLRGTMLADLLAGDGGANLLDGAGGADSLAGGDAADTLLGGNDNDTLYGGAGHDSHAGGEGQDQMRAGVGADTFAGDTGTDLVDYRTASSIRVFLDGTGTNAAAAAGDSFVLIENILGAVGNDILVGDGAVNRLSGFNGDDTIWGRAGHDQLEGEAGHDRLYGGTGNDVLVGGAGNDVFVFADAPATGGLDRTNDFNAAHDQIEIDASAFGGGLVAGGAVQFVAGAAPSAAGFAGGVFLYNTTNGFLSFDADGGGAGAAVAFFRLQNLPVGFGAADLVVVA